MLNYEIEGKGTENLVLLHGFMENLSIWDDMIPFLSEKFRLIKIDLPGFGKSEVVAEIQTSEVMADEVKKETRRKGLRIIKENLRAFVNAGVPNLFNPNEHDILESKIKLAKETAYTSSVEGVLASQKGMIERVDRKSVLENFEGKILVLSGKHDSAVNSEKTIKNLPERTNIKSYVLDCGHNGHWEKPEICASIINTELLHHLPKNLVF